MNAKIKSKLGLLESLSKRTYGTSPFRGQLNGIKQLLDAHEFRIAIVGEFSAGKSTFINALIGYDLLPHARSETTATITHIHNVIHDDPRCGKAVIEFADEREALIIDISNDTSALKDYVTSFSAQFKVVEEIRQVHVYTRFLDIDTPVVLIDTPGLNGTADGHRSLTFAEVERAHASIFLFHLRALTETDLDFLKLLARHQSQIFYLLNHIDSVNELEGESVDKVLEDFHCQISDHFSNLFFKGKECETFGISALKALVHKDTNFTKLYGSDLHELSDDDRKKIWQESRFSSFEQRLQQYVVHQSQHDVTGIALKGLTAVINDIEDNLRREIACIEQWDSVGSDERVSRYLENLEERKNKSWRTIDAYLKSRSLKLEKHAIEYIKNMLNDLNTELQEKINCSELELLEVSVNSNVYGEKINRHIIKIRNVIQQLLESNIEDIYEVGILETDRFTSEVTIDYQKSHKIGGLTFNLDEQIISREKKQLNEIKSNLNGLEFDLKKESESTQRNSELQNKIRLEIDKTHALAQDAKKQQKVNTQHLGKRPDIEYRYETRIVERDGFWGGLLDLFTDKEETYRVADKNSQRQYDRQLDSIRNNYTAQISVLDSKKNRLQAQLDDVESDLTVSILEQKHLAEKIERKEKQIKEMKQHIESKLRNHRQQVTKEKRAELCNVVEKRIQTEVLSSLKDKIKQVLKRELSLVSDKLQYYHKQKFDLYREKLALLTGQSQNLDISLLKDTLGKIEIIKQDVIHLKALDND